MAEIIPVHFSGQPHTCAKPSENSENIDERIMDPTGVFGKIADIDKEAFTSLAKITVNYVL